MDPPPHVPPRVGPAGAGEACAPGRAWGEAGRARRGHEGRPCAALVTDDAVIAHVHLHGDRGRQEIPPRRPSPRP